MDSHDVRQKHAQDDRIWLGSSAENANHGDYEHESDGDQIDTDGEPSGDSCFHHLSQNIVVEELMEAISKVLLAVKGPDGASSLHCFSKVAQDGAIGGAKQPLRLCVGFSCFHDVAAADD